jgi:hypothetical protein
MRLTIPRKFVSPRDEFGEKIGLGITYGCLYCISRKKYACAECVVNRDCPCPLFGTPACRECARLKVAAKGVFEAN